MDAQQKTSDSALGASARQKLGGFVRVPRDNGFVIGLAELRDAFIVMSGASAAFASRFRAALRALFCSLQSDWRKFDDLFDAYWRAKRSATRVFGAPQKAPSGLRSEPSKFQGGDDAKAEDVARGEGEDGATGQGKSEGASRAELLAQTDFRHLTRPEDLAEAHELVAQLAQKMRARLTRRLRAQRRGERLDLRRTIHKSIAHGGMPRPATSPRTRPRAAPPAISSGTAF